MKRRLKNISRFTLMLSIIFSLTAIATINRPIITEELKSEFTHALRELHIIEYKVILPKKTTIKSMDERPGRPTGLPSHIRKEYVFKAGPRPIPLMIENFLILAKDYSESFDSNSTDQRIKRIKEFISKNKNLYKKKQKNKYSTKSNYFNYSLRKDRVQYVKWPSIKYLSSLFRLSALSLENNIIIKKYPHCSANIVEILQSNLHINKLCDERPIKNFTPPKVKVLDPKIE